MVSGLEEVLHLVSEVQMWMLGSLKPSESGCHDEIVGLESPSEGVPQVVLLGNAVVQLILLMLFMLVPLLAMMVSSSLEVVKANERCHQPLV